MLEYLLYINYAQFLFIMYTRASFLRIMWLATKLSKCTQVKFLQTQGDFVWSETGLSGLP